MVQNVSSQAMGGISPVHRIGVLDNGRVVYQISGGLSQESVKVSVNPRDCDTFEKAYRDIMVSAPKLQKYAQTTSPQQMEKKQKLAKWIVFGGGVLGGIWPLLKAKGNGFWGAMKQAGLTLLGFGAGSVAGMFAASKIATPPGAMQFSKATQTISKLDIQPIQ